MISKTTISQYNDEENQCYQILLLFYFGFDHHILLEGTDWLSIIKLLELRV